MLWYKNNKDKDVKLNETKYNVYSAFAKKIHTKPYTDIHENNTYEYCLQHLFLHFLKVLYKYAHLTNYVIICKENLGNLYLKFAHFIFQMTFDF